MKKFARNTLAPFAIAFAGVLGIAGQASAQHPFADGLVEGVADGLYAIDVHYATDIGEATRTGYSGCLIISNSGRDTVPSVYYWNLPGKDWCGLANTTAELNANRQAVWQVYSVTGTGGVRAHVLKSHVNGQCLIRGRNGTASAPSLHLWTGIGGDAKFCGLRSADELILNGQAAWYLDGYSFQRDSFVDSARNGANLPLLTISPTPERAPNTANRQAWASFAPTPATDWSFTFWRVD